MCGGGGPVLEVSQSGSSHFKNHVRLSKEQGLHKCERQQAAFTCSCSKAYQDREELLTSHSHHAFLTLNTSRLLFFQLCLVTWRSQMVRVTTGVLARAVLRSWEADFPLNFISSKPRLYCC